MKKFTSLLIAALVAVVSFAGAPVRKSAPAALRQMTATRQLVPGKKAMTVSHPQVQNPLTKLTTSTRQKAPRKVSSISELEGNYILASIQLTEKESGGLDIAEPPYGGTPVTITKKDERTIALSGFTSDATDDILATVDLSAGTITIAEGQKLLKNDNYGTVVIANAEEDGDITGTINKDGSITLNQIWCTVLADGDYAGYMWSEFYYQSELQAVNGQMTWTKSGTENTADVLILQDSEKPGTVTVFNFADEVTAIAVTLEENNQFVIESQLVADYGATYGKFYTYAVAGADKVVATITGQGTEKTLTFDSQWTLYAPSTGYWFGALDPATITLTDDTEFIYPSIPDVATMPANPEILEVGPYDDEEGYGYVLFDVPVEDVDGNPIKKSMLYYQLYADVAGNIQPITFTPDLYKNLEEAISIIPYTFTDSYDFDTYQGYKVIYLNYPFNYNRIGVKSIYMGGGETNETEIQWIEIEQQPQGETEEFTFDFNAMDVPTSTTTTNDGDITEAVTLTQGSVSLTISPAEESARTPNRFWAGTNGPQLRMYSGTLTFTVPEGQTITSIVFSVNTGKWNVNNSADSGEFEGQTWTGSAQSVTVSIGGNTQINSIVVTVEGGSVEPVEEDVLVVLPAGIEAEAWTIEGIYSTDEDDESVSEATEVAFDGTDIYVKGLAYYFPDAWLKGTIANGVATFPSGQFVGEDEYGKEYMVGSDDGETVCDIQFAYDAGAQTLTQLTEYIVENADTKTEIYCYGWWTDVQLYAGAPEQLEPVVAPENLATEPYLFKAMAMEASYDEEEETAFEEYDTQVSVGFDGDDLYIQGLAADLPEGWVKATKNGNGQYIIPANQYMGTLDFHGLFSFDYFFTAVDEDENLMDVVLTVDPETGTITCDQILALNESRNALDYYLLFKDVVMTKIPEVAAVPADPTVDVIATGEEVNYPHVDFIIPAKSVDGQPLIQSLLSYQIFIEKNGEVQPLTLTAELYKYFTEDMTVIPYTYEDSYDIYAGGERVYLNQDREEIQTWSKLGVQSIYTAAGETNKSNIVWATVNDITDVISVMNTDNQKAQYFDLSGRAVSAPQKGLFIKQVSLQDGSVKAVKVLRK